MLTQELELNIMFHISKNMHIKNLLTSTIVVRRFLIR